MDGPSHKFDNTIKDEPMGMSISEIQGKAILKRGAQAPSTN